MDRQGLDFLNESQLSRLLRYYEGETEYQRTGLEQAALDADAAKVSRKAGALHQLRHLIAETKRQIAAIQKGQA